MWLLWVPAWGGCIDRMRVGNWLSNLLLRLQDMHSQSQPRRNCSPPIDDIRNHAGLARWDHRHRRSVLPLARKSVVESGLLLLVRMSLANLLWAAKWRCINRMRLD